MRDAKAQLAADCAPARARLHLGARHLRLEARRIHLRDPGPALPARPRAWRRSPGNFSIARTAPAGQVPRVEVRADGIDLKIAATLIDYFPVPRDIKAQAQRFAPRGRIADATLAWSGEDAAHVKAYTLKGRFEDLAVNAVDPWPGFVGPHGKHRRLRGRRHARARLAQRLARALRGIPLAARVRGARRAGELEARRARARGDDRRGPLRQRRWRGTGLGHVALPAGLEGEIAGIRGLQGLARPRRCDPRGQLPAQPQCRHARLARARGARRNRAPAWSSS